MLTPASNSFCLQISETWREHSKGAKRLVRAPISHRHHLDLVLRANRRAKRQKLFEHRHLKTAGLALGAGAAAVHHFLH